MPALRLSKELELTEDDKKLGIKVKIKVLDRDEKKTAMGIIADTFRSLPDTYTGSDVISTSGWGKPLQRQCRIQDSLKSAASILRT